MKGMLRQISYNKTTLNQLSINTKPSETNRVTIKYYNS